MRISGSPLGRFALALDGHRQRRDRSLARLAAGTRLLSARDDPGSVSAVQTAEATSRAATQGLRNLNDALSLLRVRESGLQEQMSALHRLRDLAVRNAQTSLSHEARMALHREARALIDSMNDATTRAAFNDRGVLTGSAQNLAIAVGTEAPVTIAELRSQPDLLGIRYRHDVVSNTGAWASGDLEINGVVIEPPEVGGQATEEDVVDAINRRSAETGVRAELQSPDFVEPPNSSFEEVSFAGPITAATEGDWVLVEVDGWQGDLQVFQNSPTGAADGGRFAEVDVNNGTNAFSREYDLDPGERRLLVFATRRRIEFFFSGRNEVDVAWNGAALGTVVAATNTAWSYFAFEVVGGSGPDILTFSESDADGVGGLLDDVRVRQTIALRSAAPISIGGADPGHALSEITPGAGQTIQGTSAGTYGDLEAQRNLSSERLDLSTIDDAIQDLSLHLAQTGADLNRLHATGEALAARRMSALEALEPKTAADVAAESAELLRRQALLEASHPLLARYQRAFARSLLTLLE